MDGNMYHCNEIILGQEGMEGEQLIAVHPGKCSGDGLF